jgi:3-hydroxyacyl-[acyl-carrier-protein] dehydratase
MVEAMVQSAAWLVRASTDFAASMVTLEEARNVTYKSFVSPGRVLELRIEALRIDADGSEFKGVGVSDGEEMVKARLRLRHYNLADTRPDLVDMDRRLVEKARLLFDLLGGSALMSDVVASAVND